MSGRREEAERRGRRGETLAASYLRLTGRRILAQRVKTARGEIDLVARRGSRLLRRGEMAGKCSRVALAIDAHRLRRVAAAAEAIALRYARHGEDLRIDVLLLAPWCWPRRIANAWQPGA